MANSEQQGTSLSGLTADEAKEFHRIFMASFIVFLVVAVIAHFLVWQWRPWLPGPEGYASVIDHAKMLANTYVPFAFMNIG